MLRLFTSSKLTIYDSAITALIVSFAALSDPFAITLVSFHSRSICSTVRWNDRSDKILSRSRLPLFFFLVEFENRLTNATKVFEDSRITTKTSVSRVPSSTHANFLRVRSNFIRTICPAYNSEIQRPAVPWPRNVINALLIYYTAPSTRTSEWNETEIKRSKITNEFFELPVCSSWRARLLLLPRSFRKCTVLATEKQRFHDLVDTRPKHVCRHRVLSIASNFANSNMGERRETISFFLRHRRFRKFYKRGRISEKHAKRMQNVYIPGCSISMVGCSINCRFVVRIKVIEQYCSM